MMRCRIFERRVWSTVGRFIRPSASAPFQSCSSPLLLSPAFPKHLLTSTSLAFNFNNGKPFWFSTQPMVDLPTGKIVDVPLAQTGEGIAECELLKWHVQEGDYIEDFQPICEVQSDKATIEITSRYKGKVANILYIPGDIVKVGETLLKILVDESAAFPSVTLGDSENEKSHDSDQILVSESAFTAVTSCDSENVKSLDSYPEKGKQAGVLSTPAVRSLAKQHDIDINEVCGSGKDGRVLKEDVLTFAVNKGIIKKPTAVLHADYGEEPQGEEGYNSYVASKYESPSEDRILPLRGYQRAMVKSMSLAAKVPHFHYVDEINCDALVKLKTSFQKNNPHKDVKHTFLPILIKSLSMALTKYPFVNSCFKEDSLEVVLRGLFLNMTG